MKTVTADFLTAQKRPDSKVVRTIEYKRRYWKQSTRAYDWETDWTELPVKYISTISPITWQLDTDILNEFKVSNVTLVLDNNFGYFNFDNANGFFGPDSGSPMYPYEPYWTKFRVKAGFRLADDSEETISMFTGVLSGDPVFDSDEKTIQINVQGLEATLLNTTAEDIATTVTQENVGTGNASTVDFTTLNPGVAIIKLVSKAGLTQTEGSNYSVSQLNEATLGAKVTFVVAPDVGQVIRVTYLYWPQSLSFKSLVESLLTAGGVPSLNQEVQDVIFGNSVINTQNYTTEADWEAGTLSAINSTFFPGSLIIDYDNSALRSATGWENSMTGWTEETRWGSQTGKWTSDGTKLTGAGVTGLNNVSVISRASGGQIIGSWRVDFTLATNTAKFEYIFAGNNSTQLGLSMGVRGDFAGHALVYAGYGSFGTLGLGAVGQTATWTYDSSSHSLIVSREANGRMRLFLDGVLKLDFISTDLNTIFDTYIQTTDIALLTVGSSSSASTIDNLYTPITTLTGNWISAAIDMSSTPSAWGTFESSDVPDGGTIVYSTNASADNITYDGFVDVSSNIPQSTLRRYIKIKAIISISSSVDGDPTLNSIAFRWVTSGVVVTLPVLTGSSVYEAIQKLGEFANYEFGFGPDEVFFFRPKTAGVSVLDLTQSDFNSKISGMTNGYDRMYGTVRAIYGSITKEITDTFDFSSSPRARIENKRFEINPDSNIQIPASADIATGVAQTLFAYFSKPRKRFKLMTKFLPQLDLSDVVNVTMINNTPNKLWWLGDNQVLLGDKTVTLWGEKNQLAFDMDAKIIGARYNVDQHNCEFDLEEVL